VGAGVACVLSAGDRVGVAVGPDFGSSVGDFVEPSLGGLMGLSVDSWLCCFVGKAERDAVG